MPRPSFTQPYNLPADIKRLLNLRFINNRVLVTDRKHHTPLLQIRPTASYTRLLHALQSHNAEILIRQHIGKTLLRGDQQLPVAVYKHTALELHAEFVLFGGID